MKIRLSELKRIVKEEVVRSISNRDYDEGTSLTGPKYGDTAEEKMINKLIAGELLRDKYGRGASPKKIASDLGLDSSDESIVKLIEDLLTSPFYGSYGMARKEDKEKFANRNPAKLKNRGGSYRDWDDEY